MKSKNPTITLITSLLIALSATIQAQNVQRPVSKTKLNEAKKMCTTWAKKSKSSGITQLIVSFEGLGSFSQSFADKTYKGLENAKKSKRAKKARGSMNFVAKNLIAPNLSEIAKHSEILLLSERTHRSREKTVASTCVQAWNKIYRGKAEFIILGHSFGGYAAINLAQTLAKTDVPVKAMLTMDARTTPGNYKHFWKPDNVELHINHFQKGLWMPGYRVKDAQNNKYSTNHSGITKIKETKEAFKDLL